MQRARVNKADVWEQVSHVFDLSNGALSPNGEYAACVSHHSDLESNEFLTRLHMLRIHPKPQIHTQCIWSERLDGVRMIRFSPDSERLAFVVATEHGDAVRTFDFATRQTETVIESLQSIGIVAWTPSGDGLFVVCDDASLVTEAEEGVLHIQLIPERWPWWRKRRQLLHIQLVQKGFVRRLAGPLHEISSLAAFDQQLVYVEERAEQPTQTSLFLHRLDWTTGRAIETKAVPNSYVTTPMISPDGKKLAYVGARFSGLTPGESLQLTGAAADWPAVGQGFGVNAYDTRVFVLDFESGRLQVMALDGPFCAGIPVGMSPLHQEVYWLDESSLQYIATQGELTVLVKQEIQAPETWSVHPIGHGNSRGHSFAANGLLFCFQSEQGRPFQLALQKPSGEMVCLAEALEARQPEVEWQRPFLVPHVSACGAWLCLPEGAGEAERTPLVVHVYGGASPLGLVFDDRHQVMVAQGYAVLVINPTGCGGYGRQLADQHLNDWGDLAVREVNETVEEVLKRYPSLNPRAVAVYGGSYGGFLTLRLLASCDLYRTGISISGISNLASYWGSGYFGYQYGMSSLHDKTPWSDPNFFIEKSPLFHAQYIHAPVLLMHGEFDTNVPPSESEQMFTALQAQGKTCSYLLFPGEDHRIKSTPRTLLATKKYLLAWLEKHLQGQSETWDLLTAQDVEQPFDML